MPGGRRLRRVLGHLSPCPTLGSSPASSSSAAAAGSGGSVLETSVLVQSVVQQFDREKFERDGFWVWERVLNEQCIHDLSAACWRVQQLNDEWISFPWQSLDWEALRAASTPEGPEDYMNAPGCATGVSLPRFSPDPFPQVDSGRRCIRPRAHPRAPHPRLALRQARLPPALLGPRARPRAAGLPAGDVPGGV